MIPVFNEGANFPSLWEELRSQIHSSFQALVVYDFDEDDTVPAVRKIQQTGETRLRLLKNNIRRGVIGAIRTGFEAVDHGPILVIMADLSDDLVQVDKMVELYGKGYHIVAGSRYMPGGKLIGGPVFKQGLSRVAGLTLHWFRGIPTHDATNAFKLYDRDMLRHFNIESRGGFELSLEITVKAFLAGFRITEIPSSWRDRSAGESRFRLWNWLPHYLKWYFRAFRPRRPCPESRRLPAPNSPI